MKKLLKDLNIRLITATVLSVLYVAAIPGLILSIGKLQPLMIVCIVYLAAGFYALPIIWIQFGETAALKTLVYAVCTEHIYDIKTLAVQTGNDEAALKTKILKCVEKGYITGLIFDGNGFTVNKEREKSAARRCPNCGAPLTEDDSTLTCVYCGYVYRKNS